MIPKNRAPSHPGEILDRIFLSDIGRSQSDLAKHLGWKPGKINEIVNGKRGITPQTARLYDLTAMRYLEIFFFELDRFFDLYAPARHLKHSSCAIDRGSRSVHAA